MAAAVVERLQAESSAAGLDALLCLSPENVAYTVGFVVPSQPLMRWRHAATLLTADGRQAMVCVDMEETTVRQARPELDVRPWAEFGGSAMATVAGLLHDLGLAKAVVGVELGYLSTRDHAELVGLLPEAQLVAADGLLARCRQVKSAEEIELLAQLARIADVAVASACAAVTAGDSEMDLAAALTRAVFEHGAQQFKLMIVATGDRSELPNVGPTGRVLKSGDVCRIEIFPVMDGYHAGVCRTAVVGDAPPEADRIYRNLAACKEILLESLAPGVRASQIFARFQSKFAELAMPSISFVGHGIGLDLHESPYLAPFDESTITAGMVFGIEPLVYRTGHGFGMQIKDMVAISDGGCRLLSDVTDTAEPLRIPA